MPERIHLNVGEPLIIDDSLCPECEGTGRTKMLMLNIPHFKEILIASFECHGECSYVNRDISFIGAYDTQSIEIKFHVSTLDDLNTQVILSSHATIKIPEIDLEIPPKELHKVQWDNRIAVESHGMGSLTTIEGILTQVDDDIRKKVRLIGNSTQDPESLCLSRALKEFLVSLESLLSGKRIFTFILHDPSGNSFMSPIQIDSKYSMDELIENGKYVILRQPRTVEEDTRLGLTPKERS